MKKRVRIYKPTNKFAAGGTSSSAQYTPDQLVSLYMTALAEPGSSAEQAEDTLRQIGVDENTISLISDNAQEYVNDEQYFNDALGTADADALTDITADQAAIDAGVEEEQNALAEAEEEARSAAMQEMYADYNEPDYGDDTDLAGQLLQRYGGMPSKRTFVRNVLKQVKKQMGGDSAPATVDSTDPNNDRKGSLQAFTNAVKVDGELNLAKQDAEEMYKMMTTPIGAEESYYEEPDMDYAQFGGMRRGQMRRMNRRMNRMIGKLPIGFSGMPGRPMLPGVYDYTDLIGAFGAGQMPADGSYYRGPKMANIDVRRTGLFGRPKEYTITFADDVVNNPQTAENVAKQEVKNKEEEVKDEVKAAEEGTVDQGVEEKKAEEAATQAEEEAVDINDIQVVSGNGASGGEGGGNQGGNATPEENYVDETEEVISEKPSPSFRGFWKGYDPKSVRFAGNDKSRAYIQRGNKWFVSPNFTTKDKKNVQWYEVSDPTRIKNIKASTKTMMEPLAPGSTYTVSGSNPAPLTSPSNSQKTHYVFGDKSQSFGDYISSGQAFKEIGQDIMRGANPKRFLGQSNMKGANKSLWLPGSPNANGTRESVGLGEKFQGGGFTDQASGLYQFVYGGNDNFALQSPAGKLENDSPYFAKGGLYRFAGEDDSEVDSETNADTEKETKTPSYLTKEDLDNWWKGVQGQQQQTVDPRMMMYNQMMNNFRTKQKGLPYLTGTNQAYTGALDGAKVKSIDVKKTKAFGPYKGMPKKYTVNYQVERDPLSKRLSFDESGMKLDGQSMADIAPTRQGLFNRNQQSGMNQSRLDAFLDKDFSKQGRRQAFQNAVDRVAPRLGSRLFGNDGYQQYNDKNEKVLQGPGQLSNREIRKLQRKDLYDDYMNRFSSQNPLISNSEVSFTPPKVSDDNWATEMPIPENKVPTVEVEDTRDLWDPSRIQTKEQAEQAGVEWFDPGPKVNLLSPESTFSKADMAMIQSKMPSVDLESGLEPDYGQTPVQGLQSNSIFQPSQFNQFTQPEPQSVIDQSYMNDIADQNALEAQRAEIQRMIEQDPDFFTQGVYNNPVFNPEEMTTGNIIDLNPKPVQQIPVNREVNPVVNRVTTPKRNVVPTKKTGKDKKQEVVKQNTQVPVVGSDSTKVTVPAKETTKKEQANTPKKPSKKEQSKVYITPEGSTNYAGNESAQEARDQVLRQIEKGNKKLLSESRQFKKTFGVDKHIADMYMQFVEEGDEQMIKSYRKLFPRLEFIEPQLRNLKYAYGGTLPQAVIGEDTPVNQDERFKPKPFTFGQNNSGQGTSGLLTNPFVYKGDNAWSRILSGDAWSQEKSGVRMGTDGEYVNEGVIPKDELTDFSQRKEYDDVSADFKNKGFWGAGAENRRQWMNIINPAANFILNAFDKPAQDESWRYETSTASIDRGKDVTNSGLDFPAEYGQRQFAKYGGYYQNGGLYNNSRVGEYMWMTPEMIQQFLEEGGELEFI